jgi:hypothetical protein
MPGIKRMVSADPSMLEGFSKEEEKKMVADVRAKHNKKASRCSRQQPRRQC